MADEKVSLIMDAPSYQVIRAYQEAHGGLFAHTGMKEETETWRALRIMGEWGEDEVGLVAAVSNTLSEQKMEFFYISTLQRAFILVPGHRHEESIRCLSKKFKVVHAAKDDHHNRVQHDGGGCGGGGGGGGEGAVDTKQV
uniref:CASTOR ACT domain-containing protein n=1 Tax=Lotharella oceanica TaxID=641309 RepID=A0A7S2TV10_9EUKA